MNLLNKKIVVFGILLFLSVLVVGVSIYTVYTVNKDDTSAVEFADLVPNEGEEVEDTSISYIYVEVKGAVLNPGVYQMQEGQIVNDAIDIAGGFLDSAYTDIINLSKKLSDELVIYVYTKKEFEKNEATFESNDAYLIDDAIKNNVSIITSNENTTDDDSTNNTLININLATVDELTTLPGIGESKAKNIITYREENGYFKTIDELKNVSGIGDATFEQLKNYITV